MNKFLLSFCMAASFSSGFELAVDVGHTQKIFGAISCACKKEYEYNKSLANFVQKTIELQNPKIKLSSNMDVDEVTFEDRYKLSENKDLFVSIHHDSVQPRFINFVNGCPKTSYASGFSVFVSRKNIDFRKSLDFASKFAKKLLELGLQPSTHHLENISGENRSIQNETLGIYFYDDLKVLKNAKSPAILFEAGVIVNCDDEQMVRSLEFQKKVAQAFVELGN